MMAHPSRPSSAALLAAVALGLGGWVAAAPASAAAPTWAVQPAANAYGPGRPSFSYTINPGGTVRDGLVVVNGGDRPLRLRVRSADGPGAASGLAAWVRPGRTAVTVAPGASQTVPFSLAVPVDAAPGDHLGAVVTEPAGEAGRRVAVRVRLRVGGALKPGLAVERVRLDPAQPATVTYAIRNTGNVILAARQSVTVSGPFGRWSATAGKLPQVRPLLPGETRRVSAPLTGVTRALRLTASVKLVPLLTDAAGSTVPLPAAEAAGHAWAVPWSLAAALIAACGLVAGATVPARPPRRPAQPVSARR